MSAMHVIKSTQSIAIPCIANFIWFSSSNEDLTQQIRTKEEQVKECEAK